MCLFSALPGQLKAHKKYGPMAHTEGPHNYYN